MFDTPFMNLLNVNCIVNIIRILLFSFLSSVEKEME